MSADSVRTAMSVLQTFAGVFQEQPICWWRCGSWVGLHNQGGPLEPDRALDPGLWAMGAVVIRCAEDGAGKRVFEPRPDTGGAVSDFVA